MNTYVARPAEITSRNHFMADQQLAANCRIHITNRIYIGSRRYGRPAVTVNGMLLGPRFDLCIYREDSFDWGYAGSGAAQLALAIIAEHLRDDKMAMVLHQRYKWSVIVRLPHSSWMMTDWNIATALKSLFG